MDTLGKIEKLATQAQNQKIPVFDISGNVMEQIRYKRNNTVSLAVFDFFGGVSAIAASIFAYIGINVWSYITNPITQLFTPLQEILLW